jgi:hypothetical protein
LLQLEGESRMRSSSSDSCQEIISDLYRWEVKRAINNVKSNRVPVTTKGIYAILSIFILALLIFLGGMFYYLREWEQRKNSHLAPASRSTVMTVCERSYSQADRLS